MFGAYMTMSKLFRLFCSKGEGPLGFIAEGQVGEQQRVLATLQSRMGHDFLVNGLVLNGGQEPSDLTLVLAQ